MKNVTFIKISISATIVSSYLNYYYHKSIYQNNGNVIEVQQYL